MELTRIEKMLFALLKASLQELPADESLFVGISEGDWKKCYKLAAEHGVMAVAWDGVRTLPAGMQPPRALRLTWGLAVQQYEERYERYCRTVAELSDFYAGHHIAMIQLKGVGFSVCYPVPSHREGGDIDIYTYSADKEKMTDKEANRMADDLMKRQGIKVDVHSPNHSNFNYKGIPIENHNTFLNAEAYPIAGQLNELLQTYLCPQATCLGEGKYVVQTPSVAFNALFLAFHAVQHYGRGLSLHHLFDWACLLKRYGWCLPEEVTDKRLLRFIHALTDLSNRWLGTVPVKEADADMMDKIYSEMFHPRYTLNEVPVRGKWNILMYKAKRFLYVFRLVHEVIGGSLLRRVCQSAMFHLRHPYILFKEDK